MYVFSHIPLLPGSAPDPEGGPVLHRSEKPLRSAPRPPVPGDGCPVYSAEDRGCVGWGGFGPYASTLLHLALGQRQVLRDTYLLLGNFRRLRRQIEQPFIRGCGYFSAIELKSVFSRALGWIRPQTASKLVICRQRLHDLCTIFARFSLYLGLRFYHDSAPFRRFLGRVR